MLNLDFLTNEYQQMILAGLFLAPSLGKDGKPLNILHLGTGAGIMTSFLVSQLGDRVGKITTVDLSQDMLTLGEKYFGLQNSDKVESICGDAHKFVMDCKLKGHFDIIINDINCESEDHSISPPWSFLSEDFL